MRRLLTSIVALPLCASFMASLAQATDESPVVGQQVVAVDDDALDGPAYEPTAIQRLTTDYPGVRIHRDPSDRVRSVYGKPMTQGATADEAVAAWWTEYADVFTSKPELELVWSTFVSYGKFTAYAYRQSIDGIPVEYGLARVLVLNGEFPRVVCVAGTLAQMPDGGFPETTIDADRAVELVSTALLYKRLPVWSQPQLAIYFGDGEWTDARRVWKFVGENPDLAARERFTFFVDAATGQLVQVRNEILNVDVSGTATGMGTPGTNPDIGTNPPVARPMPEIRANISGGNNSFSDLAGAFTIANAGATPVTVNAGVAAGRWVAVNDASGGAELTASANVTPPGPANLLLNPTPSEFTTAQVNAFIGTTLTHNHFRSRWDLNILDFVMPANVNIADTCNAYYDGASINFFRVGGGCVNSAYSSVISHEYGHGIVQELGLGQGGFGEGFGDTVSMMIYDDPVIGRNFSGGSIRNPNTANINYPCGSGAVHTCGQILGDLWWSIRENFGETHGDAVGLEMARQLHVDWAQITIGGIRGNFLDSAHPGTVIEILVLDDDDGDINNGTPNLDLICDAFSQVSIACPAIFLPSNSTIIFDDNFQTNQGWTVGGAGDSATTGVWTRVDPVGTWGSTGLGQPEYDASSGASTLCFVTGQGSPGGAVGTNDVDGGVTTLTSPAMNLAAHPEARIGYWRWYSNVAGAAPEADTFVVQVSNNGTAWVTVETVGPTGSQVLGGWLTHSFRVADFVTPSASVRIRFQASDTGSGSIVEAAVDEVVAWVEGPPPPCTGDFNGDGVVNLSDLAIQLSNFGITSGGNESNGDANGDGAVDLTDLALLLAVFGSDCP